MPYLTVVSLYKLRKNEVNYLKNIDMNGWMDKVKFKNTFINK